jgi:hypothetical protein
MNRFKISFFVTVLFISAVLVSDATLWDQKAQKLQNGIRTLNTLLSINPFPDDVPGLNIAITNKTEQMMSDLTALDITLQNELASLSAGDKQEALSTYAALLMLVADVGEMLALRSFGQLTLTLVNTYNVSYNTYFSIAGQYNLTTQKLPIGVTFDDGGGWIPGTR